MLPRLVLNSWSQVIRLPWLPKLLELQAWATVPSLFFFFFFLKKRPFYCVIIHLERWKKKVPVRYCGTNIFVTPAESRTRTLWYCISHFLSSFTIYVFIPQYPTLVLSQYLWFVSLRWSLTLLPGWSAMLWSWLTATSTSRVQVILLPQPPK